MLAFCSSPRFTEHDTGPHHPERPARISAILDAVEIAGLLDSPCAMALEPAAADPKWLELAHMPEHIAHVKHMCEVGGGVLDQGDTPVVRASYEIALLAVGAVLRCCDAVMRNDALRAFAAVRPPGHHAEPDRAMGFCLFNNIAIGARYIQQTYGVERVAIVDFDVHHGNGTQAVFESDPSVFFVSLHQHPRTLYPGSGYEWETGEGPGKGYTLNLPMKPGSDDADYLAAIRERIVPAIDAFKPQVLMLSAGFDAHREDPLAHIELSDDGFEQITREMVTLADAHCAGRIVSTLEGGYNLAALGRAVVRHMKAMM
jgi:acetoin utilization deacetylase AcuC-like enzyme